MDLGHRQPRDRLRAGAGRDEALHPPLPDAVPRQRLVGAILVLGEAGVGAHHRAVRLLGVRQVHAAVEMAGGGAGTSQLERDAVPHLGVALAVVQQQQLPLHGGGVHARAVREVGRRRQGGPRLLRPRPRLRALIPRLQLTYQVQHHRRAVHAGERPPRSRLPHHRRRRQHRGPRRLPAAGLLGVPGGHQEPDARLLRLVPQRRRRQGRRRHRLVHQPLPHAQPRRLHPHQAPVIPTPLLTTNSSSSSLSPHTSCRPRGVLHVHVMSII
uniref:Uncharacterized protein n=1 Tax=Oryza brachyantha TaxID=4533 RepID=J3NFB4_ORYBR